MAIGPWPMTKFCAPSEYKVETACRAMGATIRFQRGTQPQKIKQGENKNDGKVKRDPSIYLEWGIAHEETARKQLEEEIGEQV